MTRRLRSLEASRGTHNADAGTTEIQPPQPRQPCQWWRCSSTSEPVRNSSSAVRRRPEKRGSIKRTAVNDRCEGDAAAVATQRRQRRNRQGDATPARISLAQFLLISAATGRKTGDDSYAPVRQSPGDMRNPCVSPVAPARQSDQRGARPLLRPMCTMRNGVCRLFTVTSEARTRLRAQVNPTSRCAARNDCPRNPPAVRLPAEPDAPAKQCARPQCSVEEIQ